MSSHNQERNENEIKLVGKENIEAKTYLLYQLMLLLKVSQLQVLDATDSKLESLITSTLVVHVQSDLGAGRTRRQKFCKLGRISGKIVV